ncbi:hypothetical protein O181_043983 [Austropuccinia psidii MF-1]|uniref:Uncharacterized protein n=1 Tax=Austropuccinia psidii MF-1 TaxID=1389203 RepID=A0A9Q3DP80_9BASI|nr:hypothetical protein [Austropuccinia psidii MF-1]
MSLKAQTPFNTIRNIWVISPHWLLPPRHLACLRACTAPPSPSSPLLTLSHPRPYHPYACVVPCRHASSTASHPYAHVVPSQHASDNAYHPYTRLVPSQHASNTTYDPYTCVVPSRHASDTAYHPYACGVPSQHCLPSLCSCSALPTCLQQCLLSSRFHIKSIVYSGLLAYTMNAIAEIC